MKYGWIAAGITGLMLMSGCGTAKNVDLSEVKEAMIGINADGTICEVTMEAFDADYYSIDDLKTYIDEQVDAFNTSNPQIQEIETGQSAAKSDKKTEAVNAMTVDSVSESDGKARLLMTYLTSDLYNDFNGANLQVMDMTQAAASADVLAVTDLVDAKEETVTFETIAASDKLHVVYIADMASTIRTSGKIAYYSKDVTLTDDKTAVVTADSPSVIVFK